MTNLPSLLKKLQTLHRQHFEIERDIADAEREIVDAANEPKPRAKRPTTAEVVEVIRETVNVLREAGHTLPRKEIAARLGVSPWAAAYRLNKAVEMKFVEKVGVGRYRCIAPVT